jgi:hypothetical protein
VGDNIVGQKEVAVEFRGYGGVYCTYKLLCRVLVLVVCIIYVVYLQVHVVWRHHLSRNGRVPGRPDTGCVSNAGQALPKRELTRDPCADKIEDTHPERTRKGELKGQGEEERKSLR